MNFDEIKMLLAMAAARDNRIPSTAMVMAWQYDLSDIGLEEAQQALNRHFRSPGSLTDWLKPAHIRVHVKVIRDEHRKGTTQPLALPGRYEADIERNLRIKRGAAHCRDILQPILAELRRRRANTHPEVELAGSDLIRQKAIDRKHADRREFA